MGQIIKDREISHLHHTAWYELVRLSGFDDTSIPLVEEKIVRGARSEELSHILMNSLPSSLGSFEVSIEDDRFEAHVTYSYELMRLTSLRTFIPWRLIPPLEKIEPHDNDVRIVPSSGYRKHVLNHEIAHALHWNCLVSHYRNQSNTDELQARTMAFQTFFSSANKEWAEGLADFFALYSAFKTGYQEGQQGQEDKRLFSTLMLGRHLALMPEVLRDYLQSEGLPQGIGSNISPREREQIQGVITRVQDIENKYVLTGREEQEWVRYKEVRKPYALGLGKIMAAFIRSPGLRFEDVLRTPWAEGVTVSEYLQIAVEKRPGRG